jgi:hypothetical protein
MSLRQGNICRNLRVVSMWSWCREGRRVRYLRRRILFREVVIRRRCKRRDISVIEVGIFRHLSENAGNLYMEACNK